MVAGPRCVYDAEAISLVFVTFVETCRINALDQIADGPDDDLPKSESDCSSRLASQVGKGTETIFFGDSNGVVTPCYVGDFVA